MPKPTVHLVANAHLDPMWLWEWEEGAAAAVSTFRTAADLCEQFDNFIFNHNESLLYEWIEEYEPALFERIKKLVKEGKWHIMGGWHVQPDCNMPSGESFVRQIILGKTYFKEKFGVEPTTALNFDSFGHTQGLVQILVKSGYDSYLHTRPLPNDIELPQFGYIWVGYDGSEVMVMRIPGYGSQLGKARERAEMLISGFGDNECNIIPWGVGDHGGGPSYKDIKDLNDLIAERTDYEILHSTPEKYFSQLKNYKDKLPKINRDINPWGVGCYTSQIRVKQKHRLLENELYSIEKMATAAAANGLIPYPSKELLEAMKDLATCQFHDILPGSSIQNVEEAGLRMMDHGLEILSRIKARAFFALSAGELKAKENEIPILVYNPHPFPVRTQIECELSLADANWTDSWTLTPVYDKNGNPVPSQNIKEDSNINLDWRKRVVFLADLEPSQMNRFNCRTEVVPEKPEPQPAQCGNKISFSNGEIEVEINTLTGLMDKYAVNGVDYISPGAFEPIVIADDEDPWGMRYHSYRNVAGSFKLMSPSKGTKYSGVREGLIPSVRIVDDGAVRTMVEAVLEYENSAMCIQYLLPKQGSEIEVRVRVHWNQKDQMLKLQIPLPEKDGKYIGQVAYGVGNLPTNGDEAVAQKWVAVLTDNDSKALSVINDCIYASDYSEDGLRLTLLRSPAYSAHPIFERPLVPQNCFTPRMDQGERLYRFWLNAGPANERLEKIDREAIVKNEKPMALSFFPPEIGEKPKPLAILSDDTVQVGAIKQSEDGTGIVVRLFEPTGKARSTTVKLPVYDVEIPVSLSPFEIKTLKINNETKEVIETDLLERPVEG